MLPLAYHKPSDTETKDYHQSSAVAEHFNIQEKQMI